MKMNYLKAVLMTAATLCLLAIAMFFASLTLSVRSTTAQVNKTLADIQQRVDYTSQDLNAFLLQAGLVADNVRLATEKSKAVSDRTLSILNHADKVLAQLQQSTGEISSHTVQSLDAMTSALNQVNHTAGDPNIAKSLAHIEQATAQGAVATTHLAATAEDVHKVADHYEKEITTPVSILKRISGYALTAFKAVMILK